jgi:luciferase family oxidoreductase group 1
MMVDVIPFSVLDLSPIVQGGDAALALRHTLDLARHVEAWGYHRFWLAEHHNIPSVASAATAVVIAHVAGGTSSIRVGAGGIMLPNHAPLVIAEQFGTLASLFPGRIDLGLGRAPGSDQVTARALRRKLDTDAETFPQDVLELMAYFRAPEPGQLVKAVPGAGLDVPLFILGSSTFGAQLAAALSLPFAFAAHFAPTHLTAALDIYRSQFRPSERGPRPHAMVALNVIAAETDDEARLLFTSQQQAFLNLRRGALGPLPPPDPGFAARLAPWDAADLERMLAGSVVGSAATLRRGLEAFVARTGADELIVATQVFDHAARLRSYEITTGVRAASEAP